MMNLYNVPNRFRFIKDYIYLLSQNNIIPHPVYIHELTDLIELINQFDQDTNIQVLSTFPELVHIFLKDLEQIKSKYKNLIILNNLQQNTSEARIVLCSKICCLKNFNNKSFRDYLGSQLGKIYYFDNKMIDHCGKRFVFDSELINGFDYDTWLNKMRSSSTLKKKYFLNVLYLMSHFGKETRCNIETW